MRRHVLLGTAGHIDHGKTALVQALTGVDTDRLPEEKRRGITVELGFAALNFDDLTIGIVDVPGHEDLIKNMLAGATGIDMALLAIAADEGVMPQTREHFQVLRLLGMSSGVIALTKCDLVDESWIGLVRDDIASLVEGSFLQSARVIEVSAKNGCGLEELRLALRETASSVPDREGGAFRMAIDRVFSSTGHGTVVTGSVASGSVEVGAELEVMPLGDSVRVRALQHHSQSVESVVRGQRAAINLAGLHYRDIERGQMLASPGELRVSRQVTVFIETPSLEEYVLKSPQNIRLHLGAGEFPGELRVLATKRIAGVSLHFGQIKTAAPVAAVWGQPFILRESSANRLLGGGKIVDPLAYRIRPKDTARIGLVEQLAIGDARSRLCAAVALAGEQDWDLETQCLRAGVANCSEVTQQLIAEKKLDALECGTKRRLLVPALTTALKNRLLTKLLAQHHAEPLKKFVPLGRLRTAFENLEPPDLLQALVAELAGEEKIVCRADELAHSSWEGNLTAKQNDVSKSMIAACRAAGLTPPSVGEFSTRFELQEAEIEALLQFAAESQELVRLPDKDSRDSKASRASRMYLHPEAEDQLVDQVLNLWTAADEWTVSEFNEQLGLTRKYAVPLCQHLDQRGVTMRIGDRRRIVPNQPRKT